MNILSRLFITLRNVVYKNRKQIAAGNHLALPPSTEERMKKTTIKIKGTNNSLSFGQNCTITNCEIRLYGKNNRIEIGDDVRFKAGRIFILDTEGQHITIGSKTTVEEATLLTDEAASITIGQDCMLSRDIVIRTGDKHSILDLETGKRLNPACDVRLDDRVWVGRAVQVLKGSYLPADSVVAACSVVTRSFSEPNIIVAGIPAKVVKTGIRWHRDLL